MTDGGNKESNLGFEDAGYEPIRIDKKEHNNNITDEIYAEIRGLASSSFCRKEKKGLVGVSITKRGTHRGVY